MIYHDIKLKTGLAFAALLLLAADADAQFKAGSSFYIAPGTAVSIDSLTLQPATTGTDLSNTMLAVSHIPIPPAGSGLGSIARVYQFTPAISFRGNLGLRYLSSELNGNNAAQLSLVYANGVGGFFADSLTAVSNVNNYVVASTGANTIFINRITSIEAGVPLPIDLLSFTAKAEGSRTRLDWSTAQEINADHFEVERSADGRSFEWLADKNAIGNSTTRNDYKIYDEHPLIGWNYYRLKQMDRSGSYKWSQVAVVYFGNSNGTSVSAYPNPVQNKLTIAINSEKDQTFPLLLTDVSGRILQSRDLKLLMGDNKFNLDMDGLAAGSYLLKIGNGFQTKVVKEK